MFEWQMTSLVGKNGHWKLRMGYDEIGLRGQTIDLITGLFIVTKL